MKHKFIRVLAVTVLALTGAGVAAAPASATEGYGAICVLNQNTWLRNAPHGDVLLTLSAGRGFRWHGTGYDIGTGVMWLYGHGAEAPARDGWVPQANVSNCYWP